MSFTFVRQKDVMQCGVASLAMVCRYFGVSYSLDFISQFCYATSEGVSMKSISDAANVIGLENRTYNLSINQIIKCPLPAILHWNQNHFVVLYKISKNQKKYYIADPGKGLIKYTLKDFSKYWISSDNDNIKKGFIMLLKPTEKFGSLKEAKSNTNPLHFLLNYISKYKIQFFKIAFALLIGCILQMILPFLTQSIVDTGIKSKNIGFIWLILFGELMIITGKMIADFVRRWILVYISMHINISLLRDFFIKLLRLPMSFFETKLTGDLLQRINDHYRVQDFLTGQVLNFVFSLLCFIVFGIILFIYDKLIFLVFLAGSSLYGIWISIFLNQRKVLDYALFDKQSATHNRTYQFLTAMQEIKLQDCERRRLKEWTSAQKELFNVQLKSLQLLQKQEAGSIFINEFKNILITAFAATAVINGEISFGAMLAIQYIVGQLNSPVEQFMGLIYSFQDLKISLERINEIHIGKNEEPIQNRLNYFEKDSDNSISISNLHFRYDPHALKKTLEDISFNIPSGKITAIVGASGSGKTTIIKLLLGYYLFEAGSIKIAGHNLDEYNIKWWRDNCGVVMQDSVIFSDTIEKNIATIDGKVDEHKLIEAAKLANVHNFITSLPLKYNTKIGMDGIGLSQGQKQRILIARAIYKNPNYIFFDEATNALDTKNERIIVDNLSSFYKGRTVIIVAHRLSTVTNADNIVVVDKGKIVETGTHINLIEKRGYYYSLIKNQLELGV